MAALQVTGLVRTHCKTLRRKLSSCARNTPAARKSAAAWKAFCPRLLFQLLQCTMRPEPHDSRGVVGAVGRDATSVPWEKGANPVRVHRQSLHFLARPGISLRKIPRPAKSDALFAARPASKVEPHSTTTKTSTFSLGHRAVVCDTSVQGSLDALAWTCVPNRGSQTVSRHSNCHLLGRRRLVIHDAAKQ